MLQTVLYVLLTILMLAAVVLLSEDSKDRVASSSLEKECSSMCPNKNFTQDIPISDIDHYMIQNLNSDQYQYHSDNNLGMGNKFHDRLLTDISDILKSIESGLSKPTFLRAFVEFFKYFNRKDGDISVNIVVTFRWNQPDFTNKVIQGYRVQCWYIENLRKIKITDEIVSAKNLQHKISNLKSDTTYYFQVRAQTETGVGPYTDLINVSTTHENPIPRLLISTSDGLIDLDMDLQTPVQIAHNKYEQHNIIEMVYSALEYKLFWINEMQELKVMIETKVGKITNLDSSAQNLCIDWVARNLYWIQKNDLLTSNIVKLDISMWQVSTPSKPIKYLSYILNTNEAKFLNVLPSMGFLYWMETISNDHDHYVIKKSDLDGKNVQHFLRAENDTCFCSYKPLRSSSMKVDNINIENPLMYWTWKDRLIVADIYGCRCNQILNTESDEIFKHLVIDKTNIYLFSNISEQLIIYILKKKYVFLDSNENTFKHVQKINSLYIISNIHRVTAFSHSVQPYPSKKCLIPKIEHNDKNIHYDPIMAVMPTEKIVMNLPKFIPNYKCENYNLATVLYKISVKQYIDNDIKIESYMMPYTTQYPITSHLASCAEYILTLEMLNYYTHMLSLKLFKKETLVKTDSDKNPPENVTVQVLTPTLVAVYWMPPKKMNCALMIYEVRWKLVFSSNNEQQIDKQLYEYYHTAIIDKPEYSVNGKFFTKIRSLLPGQKYVLHVRIYPTNYSDFYSDSLNETFYLYLEPNNLRLKEVSANSMNISWIPNLNLTIDYVLEYKNVTMQEWQIANNTEINNNEVIYCIENLMPRTLYNFRLLLKYPEYEEDFIWPLEGEFTFQIFDDVPPGKPTRTRLPNLTYQLNWEHAKSYDSQVTLYRLEGSIIGNNYKEGNQTDENKHWNLYYIGTHNYWIIKNINHKYQFRVRAENAYGFGIWSNLSAVYDLTESVDILSSQYYLLLTLTFIALIIIICVCYFYHLYRQFKKGKRQILCPIIRDIELVPLYEIPHGNVQLNALYAPMLQCNPNKSSLTTIKKEQITLTKLLGNGAFGEVYQGIIKNFEGSDTTFVAIKRLRENASTQEKKEFLDEAKIMSNFRHRHVLRLIGICLDGNAPLLILELMESDLLNYLIESRKILQSLDPHVLRLLDLLTMCEDVARGCCYLEKMHFVHRDLACRNCLISTRNRANRVVKIGDFGLSRDIYTNDYYHKRGEGKFPIRWMAPESLIDGIFSSKSDVWSFGVLMWEITSLGEQPYPARTNIEVMQYVRAGGKLSKPLNCPWMLYQLMVRCWSAADDRPNFKVCLQNIVDLKSNVEDAALNPINIIWPRIGTLGSPAIPEKVDSSVLSSNSQTVVETYRI